MFSLNPMRPEYHFIGTQSFYLSNKGIKFVSEGNFVNLVIPGYHIPIHIISAILITDWRNQALSSFDKLGRRLVCCVAFATFALVGVIDSMARFILTFVFRPINKGHSDLFLDNAINGIFQSVYYLTKVQKDNACEASLSSLKIFSILTSDLAAVADENMAKQ